MRKRSLLQFILLLAFWLVLSAAADLQHILVGALVALISVWFWQDLGPRLPGVPSAWELLRLTYCLILMVGWGIQASKDITVFPPAGETAVFADGAKPPHELGKGAFCYLYHHYTRDDNGGC